MRDVRAENGEQLCDSGYKLPSRSRLSLSIEARVHTCISPLSFQLEKIIVRRPDDPAIREPCHGYFNYQPFRIYI